VIDIKEQSHRQATDMGTSYLPISLNSTRCKIKKLELLASQVIRSSKTLSGLLSTQ